MLEQKTITNIGQAYNADMQRIGRPAKSEQSEFGARLQKIREEARLSQREVAEQLGISQPSYAAWERRNVALPAEQVRKLAETLAVDIEDLFRTDDQKPKRRGPTGRARKIMDEVSLLPRSQQRELLDIFEVMVRRYTQSNETNVEDKKAS